MTVLQADSPQQAASAAPVGEGIAHGPPAQGAQHDVDGVFQKDVAHILGPSLTTFC